MSIISQTLEDFYHCTGIIIHYLDKNKKVIEVLGEDCKVSCSLLEKDIPKTEQVKTLVYPDHIHYIVLPFFNPLLEGWFVAGPFQSYCYCHTGIVFKPAHCAHYFEDMLKSMVEHYRLSSSQFDSRIAKAVQYVQENYQNTITLDGICEYLNLNKNYFCELFKSYMGYTFINFLNKVRIDKSCYLLTHTSYSIIEVAILVGFNNPNYFSQTFKKLIGITPTSYRDQNTLSHEKHAAALSIQSPTYLRSQGYE